MVLITISLAIVQLLAARMGVVTGKGLAELVREEYGIRWSVFATSAVLIANLGICISDFVGIGAARRADRRARADVGADRRGRDLADHRARLLSLGRAHLHLVHDPLLRLPDRRDPRPPRLGRRRARRSSSPHLHSNSAFLVLLIATAGTTITPYMQLYLQSAVVERGVREDELPREEREAVAGAVFANLIAAFIIIATGATLFTHGIHNISSAAEAARALNPFAGQYAEALFGIGLLGASLLAAAILPIATSYVVSESLGYEKGIGRRREEAPVFVGIITAMIVLSAFVAMIPGLPVISLLVGVQVVNGLLLPINLFFIWRLSRSESVMGERRSRGAARRRRRRDRRRHLDAVARARGDHARRAAERSAARQAAAAPRGIVLDEQRRADRAAEVAERRHVHVAADGSRRTGAAASPRRCASRRARRGARPRPAADDHGLDVEQVAGRGDARAERLHRAIDHVRSRACRRARARAPRCRSSAACARAPSSA